MTVPSVVPGFPAPKASSFLHALCLFDWGEFGQGNGVNIHGIGIVVGTRWKVGLGVIHPFCKARIHIFWAWKIFD